MAYISKMSILCFVPFLFLVGIAVPAESSDRPIEDVSKRIIDGQIARRGQFPYQVALVLADSKGHVCGGAILDKETILTAGHCFDYYGQWPSLYNIAIGQLVVSLRKEPNFYKVRAIRVHPNYYGRPGIIVPDDIAILKLARKITFTDKIKPISLPKSREDRATDGATCSVAGFGQMPGGMMAPQLMYAHVNVARIGECLNFLSILGVPIPSPHTRVCVTAKRWRNVCSGDSGGPLVCTRPDGRKVIEGIVSFGIGCAMPPPYPSPAIYTRVGSFLRWIKQNRVM